MKKLFLSTLLLALSNQLQAEPLTRLCRYGSDKDCNRKTLKRASDDYVSPSQKLAYARGNERGKAAMAKQILKAMEYIRDLSPEEKQQHETLFLRKLESSKSDSQTYFYLVLLKSLRTQQLLD